MSFDLFDFNPFVDFLSKNNYIKNISIQFSSEFQKNFQEDFYENLKALIPNDIKLFIIGDTSYGKCCCDEVTAMHLNSDLILRVGYSCFTQNKKLPIYYLLPNLQLNEDNITQFGEELQNNINLYKKENIKSIILFYNEKYHKNLVQKISEKYNSKILFCLIDIIDFDRNTKTKKIYKETTLYGRQIDKEKIDKNSILIYVGEEDDKLLIELSLRYINIVNSLINIDFKEGKFISKKLNQNFSNKYLFKRFNLIQKAKECETFGILIGDVSLPNIQIIIELIKNLLESQDKKVYTLLLGKITEEKLYNFTGYIDAFILIACPFNDGYNLKGIDKPILTPLDIKFAFDDNYEWKGFYSFDINYIIINDKEINEEKNNIKIQREKELSGIYNKIKKLENNETALQKYLNTKEALIPIFSYNVLDKYESKKFKGLEIKNINNEPEFTEIKKLTKGKKGIPIKYNNIE